jgi:hypothetical protein
MSAAEDNPSAPGRGAAFAQPRPALLRPSYRMLGAFVGAADVGPDCLC